MPPHFFGAFQELGYQRFGGSSSTRYLSTFSRLCNHGVCTHSLSFVFLFVILTLLWFHMNLIFSCILSYKCSGYESFLLFCKTTCGYDSESSMWQSQYLFLMFVGHKMFNKDVNKFCLAFINLNILCRVVVLRDQWLIHYQSIVQEYYIFIALFLNCSFDIQNLIIFFNNVVNSAISKIFLF